MYPIIDFWFFQIYTFWLTITICFFLFWWMLKKMSKKLRFDFSIFTNNLLWFFISIFFFSRVFYIISRWNDLKYIENLEEFFIMTDYNFSFMWWVFGFLLVLLILLKIKKESLNKYIYWIMISFLFVLPIAFIWSLLGWQVYGTDTNIWIEITYTNSLSPVPYKSPVFPLPIIYSIVFFFVFCGFYIANMYVKQKALLGYVSLTSFSVIIFILDFFSWKYWVFKDIIWLSMTQILAMFLFLFWVYSLYKIYTKNIDL